MVLLQFLSGFFYLYGKRLFSITTVMDMLCLHYYTIIPAPLAMLLPARLQNYVLMQRLHEWEISVVYALLVLHVVPSIDFCLCLGAISPTTAQKRELLWDNTFIPVYMYLMYCSGFPTKREKNIPCVVQCERLQKNIIQELVFICSVLLAMVLHTEREYAYALHCAAKHIQLPILMYCWQQSTDAESILLQTCCSVTNINCFIYCILYGGAQNLDAAMVEAAKHDARMLLYYCVMLGGRSLYEAKETAAMFGHIVCAQHCFILQSYVMDTLYVDETVLSCNLMSRTH
uniref:p360_15R n=1 Tax=African swine fever virus TaxID=10497 RepID=A0A6G7KTN3_ASF